MTTEEIINRLESLAEHCDSMIDKEPENIWRDDAAALREAVEKLKGEQPSGDNAAMTIRNIMEKENVSQKELAEKMGCVRQNVSQTLNRGTVNMRYDSFYRMVKALGYEIFLKKI